MLYTLFQILTRRDPTKASSSAPSYQLGSYRTGESGKRHAKKFKHPLSMPNDTATGSDERIVLSNQNGNRSDINAGGDTHGGHGGSGTTDGAQVQGITVQTELSVHSTQEDKSKEEISHYGFPERKPYNQYNV